jgi:hypothetical protein
METAMEGEEEITHVASTLARADEPRSQPAWMNLVKEEELYLYSKLRNQCQPEHYNLMFCRYISTIIAR